MNTYLDIVFRTLCVYTFILIAIRITGKKEISQLSIIDFVLVILVSNAVQNSMVGPDNSLVGGLVAAAVLFAVDYGIKILIYKNKTARRLLEGEPVLLVYKGKRIEKNLKSEKVSHEELNEVIRAHGILGLENVELAVMETNGLISVVGKNQ
jgi:uncharacterized membrane protein YcaP (DUF421 family)